MKTPSGNIHITRGFSRIESRQDQTKLPHMAGVQSPSTVIFVEPSQSPMTDPIDHKTECNA